MLDVGVLRTVTIVFVIFFVLNIGLGLADCVNVTGILVVLAGEEFIVVICCVVCFDVVNIFLDALVCFDCNLVEENVVFLVVAQVVVAVISLLGFAVLVNFLLVLSIFRVTGAVVVLLFFENFL